MLQHASDNSILFPEITNIVQKDHLLFYKEYIPTELLGILGCLSKISIVTKLFHFWCYYVRYSDLIFSIKILSLSVFCDVHYYVFVIFIFDQ